MKAFVLWLTVLLWALAEGRAEPAYASRFEVYPLGTAESLSTEEAVRALVGNDGTVVLDAHHHRLLVLTTAERHVEISALMRKLNLPAHNVRIEVEFREEGSSRESGFSVHGGGAVVTDGEDIGGTITIRPEVKNLTTETTGKAVQSLLVASGSEGTLEVGHRVPHTAWLFDCGRQWGIVQGQVEWEHVGARLVVQPTILGEGSTIRIRIVPELSSLGGGPTDAIRFAKAATEVTVSDGETFRLGGMTKDEAFYSRFLVGTDRRGNQQNLDILLTPHILPANPP